MTPEEIEHEKKSAAGREEKWTAETLGLILGNANGRWWMATLLERCNTFEPAYRHDGDALGMAWRDGSADVGRYLLAQIDEHHPDLYQRMIRERRARIERARAKAEEVRKKADAEGALKEVVDPLDEQLSNQSAFYQALDKKKE